MYPCLEDLSVLIVEDNAFTRKLMRSMLRQIPVGEIQEYEDGRGALKLLASKHFDIVLLDWIMPGFNGGHFLEHLNARRQQPDARIPPVLVVTANASRQVVLEAARLGADGVVAKPFSVSVLRDRIIAVLNRDVIRVVKQDNIEDLPKPGEPDPLPEPEPVDDDAAIFI